VAPRGTRSSSKAAAAGIAMQSERIIYPSVVTKKAARTANNPMPMNNA
jgi:hypothetical protein